MRKLVAVAALGFCLAASRAGADDPTTLRGFVQFYDGGVWIGAEADPFGWVLTKTRAPLTDDTAIVAYLDGAAAGVDFAKFRGRECAVRGVLHPAALTAGGVETPARTFDLFAADYAASLARFPSRTQIAAHRLDDRLVARVDRDLTTNGLQELPGATADPQDGLDSYGRVDGRMTRIMPLGLVETTDGSVVDVAFVDLRGGRYWVRRTLAPGSPQWFGPRALPRAVARVTNVRLVFTLDGR